MAALLAKFTDDMMLTKLFRRKPIDGSELWAFWSHEPINSNQGIQDRIKITLSKFYTIWDKSDALVQFWAVEMIGGRHHLTTTLQPFVLNKLTNEKLNEYRKHCVRYKFLVENVENDGDLSMDGIVGRVFRNQLPEYCGDLGEYSVSEYPQRDLALSCGINSTLTLPLFEAEPGSGGVLGCVGVLELLFTTKSNPANWYLYSVNRLLKDVGLRTIDMTEIQSQIDDLFKEPIQKEIKAALKQVCNTYALSRAITWVSYDRNMSCKDSRESFQGELLFPSPAMSIFPASGTMTTYFHSALLASVRRQGLAEKAFLYNNPYFCRDVSKLSMSDHLLAQMAGKLRLASCFMVCLRNISTGKHEFVINFFQHKTYSGDLVTLFSSILATMKQQLRTFEVITDLENEMFIEVDELGESFVKPMTSEGERIPTEYFLQSLHSTEFTLNSTGRKRVWSSWFRRNRVNESPQAKPESATEFTLNSTGRKRVWSFWFRRNRVNESDQAKPKSSFSVNECAQRADLGNGFKELDASLPSSSSAPSSSSSALRKFSFAEIKEATENFENSLLLWKGLSIAVYKGTYNDYDGRWKNVAIKSFKFEPTLEPGLAWFALQQEVWSQYRHNHVVSVIGYCQETEGTYLVYEYMPKGSLANNIWMRVTPTSFCLSWEQCLQICIDAARGLEYLHTHIKYSDGNLFIHSDVMAANIMLDADGVAKISDLHNEPFKSKHVMSAGDFDPDQHSSGCVTQSSDVYAFGVLLVKVLCRKASFRYEDRETGILFKEEIMNGAIHGVIPPDTKAQMSTECLKAFLDIAGECLNNESRERPSFTQVVEKLELSMASSFQRQHLCLHYPLHEIKEVTNNFQSELGKGGEGIVYKGVTKTNSIVAVKRLKPERSSEFQKEINMLSNLDHENLVSLVGYCQESGENILIYEFMCNGNLAQNLYGSRASSLSWKQRLKICIGAARGLRYLHTRTNSSRKGIIHRDVKPLNILLDENFNAKVSDFGLARMGLQDQAYSEIATMFKGTTGYYAPEYQRDGQITRRIDVYAFGIVLSEVLCKKKPWDREESFYPTENEKYDQWAKENIDPDLNEVIAPVCLEAFTSILDKCLNFNPKKRPSMSDVVSVLEYAQKWQEAWERLMSGRDFFLPGGEDKVVLYYKLNSEEFTRTINVRLFLRNFARHVDERDITKDLNLKEFKEVFGNSVDIHIPQVFALGKYAGDVIEVEKLYKEGQLGKLLGVGTPTFICEVCGEARACGVCKRTQWFLHCKDCDAITKVWNQWKGRVRSCLECNGHQVICSANTETRNGQIREYLAKGKDFVASLLQ